MQIDLGGKRALITAGAAGIGRAIARQLSDSGARVAICDISDIALAEVSRELPGLVAVKADVADEAAVDALFGTVEEAFGGIDILVNNAGISGPTSSFDEIHLADWLRTIEVNLTGAFLCARRAAPGFKVQRSGAIVNMSSAAGRLGMPLRAPYSASKYALRGLSDALAIELGEYGVRVNAVLPGFVDGARGQRVIAEQARRRGMSYEEYLPHFLHNISLHVAVTEVDVAAMVTFLVSDQARHVSGQSIGVCGNFESYRAPLAAAS